MSAKILNTLVFLAFFFVAGLFHDGAAGAAVLDQKLQKSLQGAATEEVFPVIVQFTELAEVESLAVRGLRRGEERAAARAKLIRHLKSHAADRQKNVIRYLRQQRVAGERPLWLINALAVKLTAAQVEDIAAMPEVESIRYDEVIRLSLPAPQAISMTSAWDNLGAVKAPDLWAKGFDGEGIVVGVMDSGVDVTHPALAAKWREKGGWFDPYKNTTLPYDPVYPTDPEGSGHGTAVTGVILGDNDIGVAPAAQWIAAKIFDDEGKADISKIHEAFQWMLDPDDDPAVDDVPNIVNNSWAIEVITGADGVPVSAVGKCVDEFRRDIQLLKNTGVAVVFAAGNSGDDGDFSPANYPESVAVGSVGKTLVVSTFSAVGPSTCDNTFYPELTAPGELIKTSTIDPAFPYALYSGTSFSTPHVAGVMALLLDAFPNASLSELETTLKTSATDLGEGGADNFYGYGLVNALVAYEQLNVPPVAAQLKAPADGALLAGTSVLFEWVRGTDANGDPLTETLVYADNASFSESTSIPTTHIEPAPLLLGAGLFLGAGLWSQRRTGILLALLLCLASAGLMLTSCGGGGGGSSTDSSTSDDTPTPVNVVRYQVDTLAPGTYYWKVVTEDSHGAVSDSEVWTFTLQ